MSSLLKDRPTSENPKELAHAIAQDIMSRERFATLADTEEILVYRNGVYVHGGEAFIKAEVQQIATPDKLGNNLVNEVIGHILRSTLVERSVFEPKNPHLMLDNVSLNLETFETESFSPDSYELSKLPVKYDPLVDCPNWKRFLNEVLSAEDIEGVQEELGAILRKRYLTKKFSIYLGDPDTGKTTLISVLLTLLGTENVSSVGIQEMAMKNPFQLSQLYGKMANIRDDLSKDVIYSAGKIKEITGGFQIQGERKHRDPFNFTNHAYLIFTCNFLPPIEEDDAAFFDRVVIRLFTKKYGGHEKPDRKLVDKLTTPEELSGILNWGIEGYKRLRDNGWNFSNTTSLEVTREDYKRRSDPVWAYVQDRVIEDPQGVAAKEACYNDFKSYCGENGIPLMGKDLFYKTLPEKVTVNSGQREIEKGQGKKHCYVGIRLRNEPLYGKKGVPPVPPVLEDLAKEQPEQAEHGSEQFAGATIITYLCCVCGKRVGTLGEPKYVKDRRVYCREHFPGKQESELLGDSD